MKLQNLYLKIFLVGDKREDDETKYIAKTTYNSTKKSLTKQSIIPSGVREGKQKKFIVERDDKTNKNNWT